MKMAEIMVIGTSHIARQSIEEVNKAIFDFHPDIVAVELDFPRYHALITGKKRGMSLRDIKYIGIKGALFAIIGEYIERKLGKIVKTKPGAEMLAAIRTAKKLKIPVALIDQDISVTLRRFSKALSWKEKWNLFVDIVKGIFFRKREMKKMGFENFDLSKVPEKELVKKAMKFARKRYPNLFRVLVTERNTYMAKMLIKIAKSNSEKKILAVVGAGHAADIKKLVEMGLKTNIYK